jgi:S1-C subfamily serine protease
MSVDESGPGAKAGVRQGDIVLAADGAPAGDVRALIRNLGPDSVGRSIRLALSRAGAPLDVDLVISERPT